jgi:hypothetical protein
MLNPGTTDAEGVQNKEDSFEDGRICLGEDIDHSEVVQIVVIIRARGSSVSTIWDSRVVC